MDDKLFGELLYRDGDQEWTGSVTLPYFAAFGAARYDGAREPYSRSDGILQLVIRDPDGVAPSPQQEAAFRYLREHEGEVFQAALAGLLDSYKAYTDSHSPLSGLWNWIGSWFGVKPIETPLGLAAAAGFTGVEITREAKADFAYIIFHVDCDWEFEHGMMVVYHKDRPAEWTTPDSLELDSDVDG